MPQCGEFMSGSGTELDRGSIRTLRVRVGHAHLPGPGIGPCLHGVQLDRLVPDVAKLVGRSGTDEESLMARQRDQFAADQRLGLAVHDDEDAVHFGACVPAHFLPRLEAHQIQLALLAGEQDPSHCPVLLRRLPDVHALIHHASLHPSRCWPRAARPTPTGRREISATRSARACRPGAPSGLRACNRMPWRTRTGSKAAHSLATLRASADWSAPWCATLRRLAGSATLESRRGTTSAVDSSRSP